MGSIEVDQTEKVDAQYNHSFIAIYSNTLLLGGGRYQPADLGPCNHCSNHLRPRLHLLSKVPLTIVDHCRRPHNTQKFSAILLATLEKDQEDSLPSWLTSGGQRNL